MGNPTDIRLGMIGAGRMALWHLRAYRKVPGVRVVALANPHSDRGARLQREFGIPAHFSDGLTLIRDGAVDAVDVCIPTTQHHAHVRAALMRGLHVYCEKPMAATAEEYAELSALERRTDRVVFNGFNLRFVPVFMRIAAAVRDGRLGSLRYIRWFRATREQPDSYMLGAEHTGVLQEFQCHFVDLLYAFGLPEPSRVRAVGTRVLPWPLDPDTVTTQLEYGDGALAEITTCSATPGMAPTLLLVGAEATLTLTAGRVRIVPQRETWTLPQRVRLLVEESLVLPHRVLRNPFLGACRHFADQVRKGGRDAACGAEAAWRVHRVLAAAARSLSSARAEPVEQEHDRGAVEAARLVREASRVPIVR